MLQKRNGTSVGIRDPQEGLRRIKRSVAEIDQVAKPHDVLRRKRAALMRRLRLLEMLTQKNNT